MELRIFKTNATSGFVKALQSAPNSFSRELCPGPRWGRLQRFPRLPSWFNGAYCMRGAGEGEGKGGGIWERKGRSPPLRKFLDPPLELISALNRSTAAVVVGGAKYRGTNREQRVCVCVCAYTPFCRSIVRKRERLLSPAFSAPSAPPPCTSSTRVSCPCPASATARPCLASCQHNTTRSRSRVTLAHSNCMHSRLDDHDTYYYFFIIIIKEIYTAQDR